MFGLLAIIDILVACIFLVIFHIYFSLFIIHLWVCVCVYFLETQTYIY